MGKTSAKVKNKYNSKVYERITLIVKKGEKEKIKAKADKQKLSLNAYIKSLIERDKSSND